MRGNKHKLMELFLYIVIVIVGIFLLFCKPGQTSGGGTEPPPVGSTNAEGGEPFAFLPDGQ